MTPGSILTLCLWICLFFCYCTETQGERAMDCCLSVSSKPIPSHVLRTYVRQNGGSGCERSAVVFITRKNIKLCATPEQPWVRGHINKLDKLQRYCKVKKFQGQKCQELKVILESLVV